MRRVIATVAALMLATVGSGCGGGGDDAGNDVAVGDGRAGVQLSLVGEFEKPLFVTQPRTGSRDLYVVEQRGRIVRVPPGGEPAVFLDIADQTKARGEAGLLSLAFAPDYERSGLLYIDYIDRSGDTRVVEYRRAGTRADERSARVVLTVDQPRPNHDNGGLLLFGRDGKLYIGLGDGALEADAHRAGQDLGTLLAKLLRIDPRPAGPKPYSIPADNPFRDRPGARPEIHAYGLRNPWRFSFDRETKDLWIADVGDRQVEEVNAVRGSGAGENFGWSAYEGTIRFNEDQQAPGAIAPLHIKLRTETNCAIIGGPVVRDRHLRSLYGRYLYGDLCSGKLSSFSAKRALDAGRADDDRELGLDVPALSSFGEDAAGRVYAISLAGPVYRLDPTRPRVSLAP